MATYCTPADVRAALTPDGVEDQAQTAASLEDWQLLDAIDEAEGAINGYFKGYQIIVEIHEDPDPDDPNNTIGFTAAPDPVRRWTRNIAAYLAALTFRKNKDLPEDDPIRLRYNMTMGFLSDVRSGVIVPPLPVVDGGGHQVQIFNLYEGTLFGPEDFNLGPDPSSVQQIWRAETAVQ